MSANRGWQDPHAAKVGVIKNPTGIVTSTLRSIVDAKVEYGRVVVGANGREGWMASDRQRRPYLRYRRGR